MYLFIYLFLSLPPTLSLSVSVSLCLSLSLIFGSIFFRDHFYQYGEIQAIHMVHKQNCAFITYTTRPAAEKAAEGSFGSLIIKGTREMTSDLQRYFKMLVVLFLFLYRQSFEGTLG